MLQVISQQYIMGINIRNTGAGEHVHVQCYIMWQYMYVYVLWLDMLPWPCEVHVCQKMWNLLMWIIMWYETVLNLYSCSRCLAIFICNLAPKSHLLICIHCEKDVLLRRIDNHDNCRGFLEELQLHWTCTAENQQHLHWYYLSSPIDFVEAMARVAGGVVVLSSAL